MTTKLRLDQTLVERGSFSSRARAQAAIRAGLVRVGGAVVDRPAAMVADAAAIEVMGAVHDYVSRGGVKLDIALRTFEIDPDGKTCLDLGASTGGFTDVLLRMGAAKIYAVDVGSGQLHDRLRADPRIVNLEKTHAKDLTRALIPDPVDLIVADVSFIGLRKALPPALALAAPAAGLVALIKPQFELGPAKIGKRGVVDASPEEYLALTAEIVDWLSAAGWTVFGVIDSPIAGGDGNKEFLIGAARPA